MRVSHTRYDDVRQRRSEIVCVTAANRGRPSNKRREGYSSRPRDTLCKHLVQASPACQGRERHPTGADRTSPASGPSSLSIPSPNSRPPAQTP
eukprot:5308802-Pleurochrysis_carterae.AAC.1